jgi:actin-like ATPase involved in cell morphogenesis
MACYRRSEQVASASNSFAGNAFDRAIITNFIKKRRYRPSQSEAERMKLELASLSGVGEKTLECDVIRPGMGLPKKLTVTEAEVSASFAPVEYTISLSFIPIR